MFEYELHRIHHAELLREAAAERLAHEAADAAKGRRRAGKQEPEGRVGGDRNRFARAA
ncbi:hypothetical protein ACFU3J_13040 [Streptomyces sp. NPDC057411]|uniref:hypothetical protein n=1 Tax=unclassified Streptomyces TaxID=2593676 RepID=UPI003631BB4B